VIHQLLLLQYYPQDQELSRLAWWKKQDHYRNLSFEYYSCSFYYSVEIVSVVVVVLVASIFVLVRITCIIVNTRKEISAIVAKAALLA
jgi:hypothetical protein